MLAIRFSHHGAPDVLEAVELPVPVPGPGQVLIRVAYAAVNFADVVRRAGRPYPFPTPLPFRPGSEVSGTVAALGEGVAGPPVGTPVLALTGGDGSQGYAQFALAAAPAVIPVPEGLGMAQAAGVVVAGLTATLALTEVAPVREGSAVFVPAAAGGVGSFAVQLARLLGATTVVAGAGSAAKRRAALALGATHAVDTTAEGWAPAVVEATGGRGVDVALEVTGGVAFPETLRALAPFGRLVVLGQASGRRAAVTDAVVDALLYDPAPGQSVHAFNLGAWFGHRPAEAGAALGRLLGHVAAGDVRVPVGQVLALTDAAEAHRLMESRASTGKIVLEAWTD